MSAGINTIQLLPKILLAVDDVWADSARNKDYIAEVGVVNAIKENQNVMMDMIQNPSKDRVITVYWNEFCHATTKACTDKCVTAGTEFGSTGKDYGINLCREVEFSLTEEKFRTIATTFEEAQAISLLANLKVLDEWVNEQAINRMITSVGVNRYSGGKGTVSGFKTSIAAAYWNASLFSYFRTVQAKNRFNSPYLISGTNLFEAYDLALANAANSDGKGALTLFQRFKMYFDIFTLDSKTTAPSTFMLNSNALAFVSKTRYPTTPDPSRNADGTVGLEFTIASPNIPGLNYDVIYRIACVNDQTVHNWKVKARVDVLVNPVGCDLNNTNILQFTCE